MQLSANQPNKDVFIDLDINEDEKDLLNDCMAKLSRHIHRNIELSSNPAQIARLITIKRFIENESSQY